MSKGIDVLGLLDSYIEHGIPQERPELQRAREAVDGLIEALFTALPYVESAESDAAYKNGAVRKVTNQMRLAIAKAVGGGA